MKNTSESVQELAAEGKRAYMRAWRAKNKDKIHQYNQKYWARKASEQRKKEEVSQNG